MSLIKNWLDWTVFLPSDLLFHPVWERLFAKLMAEGLEGADEKPEPAVVHYLQTHVSGKDEEGLWAAKWTSSLLNVGPGFSSYSANALEALWHRLD